MFCRTPFWDGDLAWSATRPDLTECFHSTVPYLVPTIYLWIFIPYYVRLHIKTKQVTAFPARIQFWSSKMILKSLLTILSIAAAFCYLSHNLRDDSAPSSMTVMPLIFILTLFLGAAFTVIGQRAHQLRTSVLFYFWTLATLAALPTFLSSVRVAMETDQGTYDHTEDQDFRAVFRIIMFSLAFLMTVLNGMAETPKVAKDGSEEDLVGKSQKERGLTPEDKASPVSILLFTWMDPMIWAGFKKPPLMAEQVPPVKEEMAPEEVRRKFEQSWSRFGGNAGKNDDDRRGNLNTDFRGSVEMVDLMEESQKDQLPEEEDHEQVAKPDKYLNVVWPLFAAFGLKFGESILLKIAQDLLKFVSPQILKALIRFVQDEDAHPEEAGSWRGYFLASSLFAVNLLQLLILQQYWIRCYQTGMEMRTAVVGAIYRKSLKLGSEARRSYNLGEIVNLVTTDASTIQEVLPQLNLVWSMPLQIILALYFLYEELGLALLSGVLILLLLIPFNTVIERFGAKYERSRMKAKDRRIRFMYEILNSIKVIKCNAWEENFRDNVEKVRSEELSFLKKKYTLTAFSNFVFGSVPILVTLSSFGTYVAINPDNVLTADKVFVCISLFNLLRLPMHLLPWGISSAVRYWVSAKRISKYLSAKELKKPMELTGPTDDSYGGSEGDQRYAVRIKNGVFTWGSESVPAASATDSNPEPIEEEPGDGTRMDCCDTAPNNGGDNDEDEKRRMKDKFGAGVVDGKRVTLCCIDLQIPKGSLVAIVGKVGSGKSTLLSSILNETEKLYGNVSIKSSGLAYVSQQPWIQNMTVKQNILFGVEHKQDWYDKVVSSCALLDDFAQLSEGEETQIGENGINLSGGQKQRVAIARAAYRGDGRADLFLFDDPLSALDGHTGNHVFDKVIGNNGILSHTTRILVTHRRNIVCQADYVAVMKDGRVFDFGVPNKLMSAGSELSVMLEDLAANGGNETADNNDAEEEEEVVEKEEAESTEKEKDVTPDDREKESEDKDIPDVAFAPLKDKEKDLAVEKRLKDQEVLSGRVKMKAYNRYLSAIGYVTSVAVVGLFIANQAISTGSTVWLAAWSDHSAEVTSANGTDYDNGYYLGVFGGFGAAQAILSFSRNFFMYMACASAAASIHKSLLNIIMKAKTRFFDITPTGSVINRFSGDMNVVDRELPQALNSFMFTLVEVLSVMVVISISFPYFAIIILPLGVLYYFLLRVYIPSSRQIKRFESATKSPINLHFSESVQGAHIIRAFNENNRFISESEQFVEGNLRHAYAAAMCRRWLALRSELTGNLVVLLAALLAVAQRNSVTAGWVGLTVSFAMSVTETFNWVLLNGSSVEEKAVAVERVRETERFTPTEREWRKPDQDPKESRWLKEGNLKMTDVSLAYSDELPEVLHSLTLNVESGQKIGVCGRTGAGKSSLAAALFNLVDSWSGKIELDGVDIRQIGLHTLRSQLTIIPQDPILFNRTVRENIDPINNSTDEEIWRVIEQSQMKPAISSLKGGLNHMVEEGGVNFSVGQRQLLCLARALLRDSALVMLDEATASMDEDTDEKVQETLFKELSGRTVITIAHRLDTIVNYDKILVLDQGRIKEFDTPSRLLKDHNSAFYKMMQHHNSNQQ